MRSPRIFGAARGGEHSAEHSAYPSADPSVDRSADRSADRSGDKHGGPIGGRVFAALRYTEAGLCAVATAIAGLLYGGYFATRAYQPPVLAAAAAGALLAAVAGARRWPLGRSVLVAVGGFVVLAGYGVFHRTLWYGLPTLETGIELGSGVARGWMRMLTVGLPADAAGELLVTPVLLSWAAAFTAVTLVLRSRSVAAPVAPLVAVFGAGLLYVASRPGRQVVLTGAFLLVVMLLLLLRANRVENPNLAAAAPADLKALGAGWAGQHRRATVVRIARGLPVVLALAALGAAGVYAAPLAKGEQRFDPRELRPPRLAIDQALSPLAGVKAQLREDPARHLFTVRVGGPGAAGVDRIRISALEEFDGALWSSADRYLVAGRTLARDPRLTGGRAVTQRVEISGLPGPFLPAAGWPVRLRPLSAESRAEPGAEVWFSARSGTLVTDAPALRGFGYEVTGEVRRRDGLLPSTPTASAVLRPGSARLPGEVPPQITSLARQLTRNETTPYGKLVAIEEHLRTLPYSLDAPPGHSYGTLATMLGGDLPEETIGYAEQHAAAFAVLARSLGIPVRVAVGYLLRDGENGMYTVSTRNAHAWAEVSFEGYGWVPFEPTDTTRLPVHVQPPQQLPIPGAGPSPGPGAEQPQPPGQVPPVVRGLPEEGERSGNSWIDVSDPSVLAGLAWAGAGLGALLVAAALAIVAEKRRRRWRRRRAIGRAALLGAWREATDRLVESGVRLPPALTAQEVAERAAVVVGPSSAAVAQLAPIATRAVFAADEPDQHAVWWSWELEAQLRRKLDAGRGPLGRLRARLDPRPLLPSGTLSRWSVRS